MITTRKCEGKGLRMKRKKANFFHKVLFSLNIVNQVHTLLLEFSLKKLCQFSIINAMREEKPECQIQNFPLKLCFLQLMS